MPLVDSRTSTFEVPVIWTCPSKGCNEAARSMVTKSVTWETYEHLGKVSPRTVVKYEHGGRFRTYLPNVTCESCGATMLAKPVKGVLNESTRCDARCENAKGSSCECSCAGMNHGRGLPPAF